MNEHEKMFLFEAFITVPMECGKICACFVQTLKRSLFEHFAAFCFSEWGKCISFFFFQFWSNVFFLLPFKYSVHSSICLYMKWCHQQKVRVIFSSSSRLSRHSHNTHQTYIGWWLTITLTFLEEWWIWNLNNKHLLCCLWTTITMHFYKCAVPFVVKIQKTKVWPFCLVRADGTFICEKLFCFVHQKITFISNSSLFEVKPFKFRPTPTQTFAFAFNGIRPTYLNNLSVFSLIIKEGDKHIHNSHKQTKNNKIPIFAFLPFVLQFFRFLTNAKNSKRRIFEAFK